MFFELIATFAAGFAAAGLVLAINLITKGRLLPKWAMPVVAGAAMIGVAIAGEYSWGTRTIANLPEDVIVLDNVQEASWWRPWSYLTPPTVRIRALDPAAQTHADHPDLRLVDLYFLARWQAPAKASQLVDCANETQADATATALADPESAFWAAADPRLLTEFCGS